MHFLTSILKRYCLWSWIYWSLLNYMLQMGECMVFKLYKFKKLLYILNNNNYSQSFVLNSSFYFKGKWPRFLVLVFSPAPSISSVAGWVAVPLRSAGRTASGSIPSTLGWTTTWGRYVGCLPGYLAARARNWARAAQQVSWCRLSFFKNKTVKLYFKIVILLYWLKAENTFSSSFVISVHLK